MEWKTGKKNNKDCGWVQVNPKKRCKLKDKNGKNAKKACPIACGKSKKNCAMPNCWEGSSWQAKKSTETFTHCKDLKKMKKKKDKKLACGQLGTNEEGINKAFAYTACKKCGYCETS